MSHSITLTSPYFGMECEVVEEYPSSQTVSPSNLVWEIKLNNNIDVYDR